MTALESDRAVVWTGSKPPTARALAAIRSGWKSGAIQPGDRLSSGRVRKNPSTAPAARNAYTAFHWGNLPDRVRTVQLPSYSSGVYELGELRAVEYQTRKKRVLARWVHEFKSPYPVLTATPSGKLGPIVGGRAFVTKRGIED